jgi:hypothetical protein
MRVTIVTPAMRAPNVPAVVASVRRAAEAAPDLTVLHLVAHWTAAPDPTRERLAPWLTSLLTALPTGWLLFCDDDNVLHPSVLVALQATVDAHPEARAVVFGQARPDFGGYLAPVVPPTLGRIDGGQVALRTDYAALVPWHAGAFGDGQYLTALYHTHPAPWVCVDEALTYHNAQEWFS